jgi:hypothetical protein
MWFILMILARESDFDLGETGRTEPLQRPWRGIQRGQFRFNVGHRWAGSVGLKDLGEPSPEHRKMTKATLALGRVDGGEEITRQNVFEKHGVSAERATGDDGGGLPDRGLQPPLGSGKNGERKVGQERLFGHTF